jgi:beta-lactamase class A
MKQKFPFFRVGYKTYFHYQNGVLIRKNRTRLAALNISIMLVISGGFFSAYTYLLPVLQTTNYLQAESTAADQIVAAEQATTEPPKLPIAEEDELLKFAINQKIASFGENQKWSVYAYELDTDKIVKINENQNYDAASLYKLFLLEALEDKISFDKWQHTYVHGKSISSCVELMLRTTDDPCSEALAEYAGWDFIDEYNKKSGFENTSMAGLKGRYTTASDTADLLVRLKKGHTLSDSARRFVFDALYQQSYSAGLAKGCGDCRTASKSGELSNISHDGGVITHGSKSYVLVVMSEGGSFEQISEITKLVDERFGVN